MLTYHVNGDLQHTFSTLFCWSMTSGLTVSVILHLFILLAQWTKSVISTVASSRKLQHVTEMRVTTLGHGEGDANQPPTRNDASATQSYIATKPCPVLPRLLSALHLLTHWVRQDGGRRKELARVEVER